ncbi:MAG: 50S ribosomal protein L29 [Omnitrophica WOR_2 bacterium RIFCSPHIGHO2_01_FULL_48_9]|nr:MAG: 50S ribosomal protein L29 [Omnitrophica WOR_2 bacterium RIFCSPHIGHO2_02_FULL_48_11]OGX33318.1 MAG: 50S ribosomal protein L29 [Omnitrophica WOR_2 bacterium RIFCSPHIGHO2_01_FULL_48_9]
MKVKEYRAMSSEELLQKEKIFKKELFDLNYQRRMGQVEKPGRFRNIRKGIARILTILKERENDGSKR